MEMQAAEEGRHIHNPTPEGPEIEKKYIYWFYIYNISTLYDLSNFIACSWNKITYAICSAKIKKIYIYMSFIYICI